MPYTCECCEGTGRIPCLCGRDHCDCGEDEVDCPICRADDPEPDEDFPRRRRRSPHHPDALGARQLGVGAWNR